MTILCTGHKGFIGSHLFWDLRSRGYDVTGIDRKDESGEILFNPILKEKFDIVIHCAANLFGYFEENLKSTRYLISTQTQARFIFLSSAAVYGNSMDAKETDELNPWGEYGKTKAEEEELIMGHSPDNLIFRLSNVYGVGTDHGVYQAFIHGGSIINYPDHIRDFIDVDTVVSSIICSFDKKGIWNISSGKGTKIKDLFEQLNPGKKWRISGSKPKEIEYSILNNKYNDK